jgi:restriction system protein
MPAIPSHDDINQPLLRLLKKRREVSLQAAIDHIAETFGLGKPSRTKRQPCGKETVLQNRLRWARWELQREGKVRTTRRGYFAIA